MRCWRCLDLQVHPSCSQALAWMEVEASVVGAAAAVQASVVVQLHSVVVRPGRQLQLQLLQTGQGGALASSRRVEVTSREWAASGGI